MIRLFNTRKNYHEVKSSIDLSTLNTANGLFDFVIGLQIQFPEALWFLPLTAHICQIQRP